MLDSKIGFIGLGKLGMPCAEAIAKKGFAVSGFDIDRSKRSEVIDICESVEQVVDASDIVFIATPTPHEEGYDGRTPTSHLQPKDFNYDSLKQVLNQCNQHMDSTQTLVLISTVLPGTVRKELQPLVSDLDLIYNPYLIAMGTVSEDMLNPEMIMIGTENASSLKSKALKLFYETICENNPRMELGTWEEVEAMKIFYNTFISNKIALVNMIQDVSHKLGHMDADRVTQALANSTMRITSPAYMKPGMGDGGSCHPRDNIALRWLSAKLDLGYDLFGNIMQAREKQAENMAMAILKHGQNIYFSSDTYKHGTNLIDGSYSLLVQHYVIKNGGRISDGFDSPVDVIVKVHEQDQISADHNTVIFDPWRSHPKGKNVIYYGKYN